MNSFYLKSTDILKNYDAEMILEKKENLSLNFVKRNIVEDIPNAELNFSNSKKNNNNEKSNNKIKTNYLVNMDINNNFIIFNHKKKLIDVLAGDLISNYNILIQRKENENFVNNREKEKDENLDISYNYNDLEEIYDSKNIKNKILCCELLNFIEIFIQSVLYTRKVFPQEAFNDFIIYNLNLKIITEPQIIEYISEFLSSLEILALNNMIKRIIINIIDPENKKILEYFSVNIEINEFYNNLIYSDICLHFKSLIYKFYSIYSNKKEFFPNSNKSFYLNIETRDSKVFCSSNFKNFKEITKKIEENFVIEIINNTELRMISNKEIYIFVDHVNFHISISRNF
jgi:hypothetical protein